MVLSEKKYRHITTHISPHLCQLHILGSDVKILHTYISVLVSVLWKFADLYFLPVLSSRIFPGSSPILLYPHPKVYS